MTQATDITGALMKKAETLVNKKKRSLDKIKTMGLENYLKSKIEKYADSPILQEHYKNELRMLAEVAS